MILESAVASYSATIILIYLLRANKLENSNSVNNESNSAVGSELADSTNSLKELKKSSPTPIKVTKVPPKVDVVREDNKIGNRLLGRIRKFLTPERFSEIEKLREDLISADIGVAMTDKLLKDLEKLPADEIKSKVKERFIKILEVKELALIEDLNQTHNPALVLFVGVNGVGKTTTVGKIASKLSQINKKVLLVAGDTFRAAAGEQLSIWGDRTNLNSSVTVYQGKEGSKPSTVIFESIQKAKEESFDYILIDTAGRLHNRANLMKEMEGMMKIITRELPTAPHESILVIDGCTGQNGLTQAREFSKIVPLTGVVVTKLDGSSKGGIILSIKEELGVPIKYVGIGEGVDDLINFDAKEFVEAVIG